MTEWATTLQHMALWGPGLVILWGTYKVVNSILGILKEPPAFMGQFIAAQQAQAVATGEVGAALRQVLERIGQDDYERREVLGVMQVLAEDMREVRINCRATACLRVAPPPPDPQKEAV
jgi:hypothetical protein